MIEREERGGTVLLRLANGPVNTMDLQLCQELAARLRDEAAGPARAVVLTGAGSSFSAGVDLKRIVDGGIRYVDEFFPALVDVLTATFELGKPVVAAVNGHAIAGGCVLAAAADVTLMAAGRGRIGVPELRVGVAFPRIALEILRYKVGDVAARKLVVGADTHLPERAAELGLVDRVVDGEKLVDEAIEAAQTLVDLTQADSYALAKAHLHRDATERVARYDDEEAHEVWRRRVADGGIARYLESLARR